MLKLERKEGLPKKKQRRQLYSLLGDLPPRNRPIKAEVIAVEKRESYHLEKLRLDLNGEEIVPAYFIKPLEAKGALPTVLFNHSHGGKYYLGKDELLLGNSYMASPPYAEELTRLGYAALAIDHWLFGERSGREEIDLFKETLWRGEVLWGKMVYDSLRAIDYLHTRKDVDISRLATLGMSMGSTMAWWVAALDERIKVCIDICCLTDFDALIQHRGLKGHGIYYYVPGLLKHFSTSDINRLIVPRPHLALAGRKDELTPIDGLERIDRDLKEAYALAGKPQAWKLVLSDEGHLETPEFRQEVIEFLKDNF
ncbi:MAG: dienelactone hydrolase family protein [candidate division KSB1 bacterium]|nr:dienelactone hydrolase family protein [candidate division KSB1 bacterium]